MTTAIVVGSGPNGLVAAVTLASQGVDVTVLEAADTVGGGTRTSQLTVPGLRHDHCSAFHPMALASPALRDLNLGRHGLVWRWPTVDLAHPLDSGRVAIMVRSLDETVARLGPDGPAWRRLFGPLSDSFDGLAEDLLRPVLHWPRHPLLLARFGLLAALPATVLTSRWRTAEARALFAGVAAHAFRPLDRPVTSAIGLMLTAAGHRYGWPVAEGGSQAIADALVRVLAERGGRVQTGRPVSSLEEVRDADVVLLDLAPAGVLRLAGTTLPAPVRRAYQRYRYGPGAFKLDLAVEGGIPWTAPECRQAGTVHVGGTVEQVAEAELEVHRGRLPARLFVLVGQQYLADPTRSSGDVQPIWAYAHVPHGYPGDATEPVLRQLERFAPGVRERVVAQAVTRATDWPAYNANYVGGDIVAGANTALQLAFRPRPALDPYATGIPGVYICSAATPPGGGVHGMCGQHAAQAALRWLMGQSRR